MNCVLELFLIQLVKERPAIYDYYLLQFHNKALDDRNWEEISSQLSTSVDDCKLKWKYLRNSYARHLRREKIASTRPNFRIRKPWYLAKEMSFMEKFMTNRRSKSCIDFNYSSKNPKTYLMKPSSTTIKVKTQAGPSNLNQIEKKNSESSGPMVTVLEESNTESIQLNHPFLKYVNGLTSDFDKLTTKQQRFFKKKSLEFLYELLDQQEDILE